MNIATRNFLRLLRAGAFDHDEPIEPMSAWKWRRLREVAIEQGVARIAYRGIQQLADQFFLQIPDDEMQLWRTAIAQPAPTDDDATLKLSNRTYRRRLDDIIAGEPADSPTLTLLKALIRTTRHLLDDGFYLRPLIQLALLMRPGARPIDAEKLGEWLAHLGMERVARFEASLIVMLLGLDPMSMPIQPAVDAGRAEALADDLFSHRHPHTGQMRLRQAGDIFVHTSNSRAMLWQARRSAHYFRYYPQESVSNLLASLARSLTDIEE